MCARWGCATLCSTRSIPRGNGAAPQDSRAGRGQNFSSLSQERIHLSVGALWAVCSAIVLLQERLLNFIRWSLGTDDREKSLWLQRVLQVLEGEILVLLWAVQAGCV